MKKRWLLITLAAVLLIGLLAVSHADVDFSFSDGDWGGSSSWDSWSSSSDSGSGGSDEGLI